MPTVADLIGASLVRAGARAVFTSGGEARVFTLGAAGARPADAPPRIEGPAASALVEAMARQGLRAVHAGRGAAACVMAAVTGWLTDAPGLAVLALDDDAEIADALAQAFRDRAPLVAVTDRHIGMARGDAVKASLAVTADSAARLSAQACQLALTEPRAPVHLVVAAGTAAASAVPVATAVRPAPLPAADPEMLDRAAALLGVAQRPVLVAGGQCRSPEIAMWLRALAEALPAPVVV